MSIPTTAELRNSVEVHAAKARRLAEAGKSLLWLLDVAKTPADVEHFMVRSRALVLAGNTMVNDFGQFLAEVPDQYRQSHAELLSGTADMIVSTREYISESYREAISRQYELQSGWFGRARWKRLWKNLFGK